MLTEQQDAVSNLEHAILGATGGQSTTVDQHALKAVKALCKINDVNCSAAADLLLARLKSDDVQVNAYPCILLSRLKEVSPAVSYGLAPLSRLTQGQGLQVRLQALSVTDQLFSRSRVFRKAFLLHLDQFLELAVGIRANHPLPGPTPLRDRLREEALELIDVWSENWGGLFPQVSGAHFATFSCRHLPGWSAGLLCLLAMLFPLACLQAAILRLRKASIPN